jgi:heat shock protein HslJ
MSRRLIVFLLPVALALIVSACSNAPPPPTDCSQWKWQDATWDLQSYGEPGHRWVVLSGTRITAQFISNTGRVAGTAGCNTYFGNYTVDNCTLYIGEDIATTKMSCVAPTMQQEQNYLALLKQAERFVVGGKNMDQLTIVCGKQELVYRLIPHADPASSTAQLK